MNEAGVIVSTVPSAGRSMFEAHAQPAPHRPGHSSNPDCLVPTPRKAPIRQAILDFLVTPKTATEIAEHIRRPIPTATGHLRATGQLGLTKRVARSFYVLTAFDGVIPTKSTIPRTKQQIRLRHAVIQLLHDRLDEAALCRATSADLTQVQHELLGLWRNGFLFGDRERGWQLRDHIKRRFPRSVRD